MDLNTLQKIVLINGLNNAVGLLVSSDLAYTYISEQSGGGRITRYSLQDGVPMVIASGLTNPFFLKWLDAAQSTIILTERDPTNHITLVDTVPHAGSVRKLADMGFELLFTGKKHVYVIRTRVRTSPGSYSSRACFLYFFLV